MHDDYLPSQAMRRSQYVTWANNGSTTLIVMASFLQQQVRLVRELFYSHVVSTNDKTVVSTLGCIIGKVFEA